MIADDDAPKLLLPMIADDDDAPKLLLPPPPPRSVRALLRAGTEKGLHSVKAQAAPGFSLWCIAALTLVLYSTVKPFADAFEKVGRVNGAFPYVFGFVCSGVAGGAIPSALLFDARNGRRSVADGAFNTLAFGLFGAWVAFFYSIQTALFGSTNSAATVAQKVFFDQIIFTPPLHIPYFQLLFLWRNARYPGPSQFHQLIKEQRVFHQDELLAGWWFPALFPTWLIWMPCGVVTYSLPTPLQIPMFTIVTVFFGLIQQFLGQSSEEPPKDERRTQEEEPGLPTTRLADSN